MNSQRRAGAILSYINIIVKNLVTFFYTPFLLTHVGQIQFGLFQMTNSVVTSLSILSMGLSGAYVKFYVNFKSKDKPNDIKKLNGLYLILFTLIGGIALLIGAIITINTQNIYGSVMSERELELVKKLMIVLSINLAITFPSSVFDSNIMVNERFKFQQIRQLIQSLLVPTIAIPLILSGMNVLAIGVTQILVTIIFMVLNFKYCYQNLNMRFLFVGISFKLVKSLFIFSFFILLNQVVDIVNNNGPSFVLGIVLGAKQVATFAIAIQVKNMFFMLSTSLSTVFIPKVNEIVNQSNNKNLLTDLMIKVGRIQMTILFFVLGGFIILGQYFINMWAGSDNSLAYGLVIAMVLPSIIPLSQNIGIEIQRAMNMHIFRSLAYIIFAFLNLILTYVGTKVWGLPGSVIGYIVSIVTANGILMNWYYHVKMKLNIKKYWLSVINVSLPFIIVTTIFKLITNYILINSFSKFVIFGLLYSCSYILIFYIFSASNYEKNQLSFLERKCKDGN